MNWRNQYNLINGMVGKSILVISLVTPVSYLINLGVDLLSYKITLSGAILVMIAYLILSLSIPQIIVTFPNSYSYNESLMKSYKKGQLDFISEFKILEENSTSLPKGYDGFGFKNLEFKTIEECKHELSKKIALRSMALLKYEYINKTKCKTRKTIAFFFGIGVICFYLPLVLKIISIFNGE